ncbi:hypothetical protein D9Q98_009069 [Chlorella vulgaris]|uniref:Ureidoglycolate hydrolase n=1 Tax=Chlorella vulgaris TaxID=3077 RepID=A0A9D4YTN1_CHLVU|nr:hypothetical protein D9Q98_009069 [Chlorella vulgaris]
MAATSAAMAAHSQQEPQQQQQHGPRSTVQLKAVDISEESFRPFGQLIGPTDDGKEYDGEDAQLEGLGEGQPRFYIMRLPRRGRTFERITYHAQVTQCLGCLQPASPWFLVVSRPTLSVAQHPRQQDLTAFRIPHGVFVKLHKGTWHAGPLFDAPSADFYNLELADTNVVDHNTYEYGQEEGLCFEVVD